MSPAYDVDPLYGVPRPKKRTWSDVLGEFEAELARAEALLQGDDPDAVAEELSSWTPPADLGPLPSEHVEWARLVLDRQRHVLETLREAVSRKHQQRAYAANAESGQSARRSMYVDSHA